jgi:hypothetical protein
MDELDHFRDFRLGAAGPSEDAQRRASARLGRAIDAERAHGSGALRWIQKHPRYIVLAVAALAGATAAALFVTTTLWNNTPGVLERAQAALAPQAGRILHEKWEVTSTSTDPACTVKRGPNEIWIDQRPPYRYRILLGNDLPAEPGVADYPRGLACPSETASEFGGMLNRPWPLEFVPPNSLTTGRMRSFRFPLDPVTDLREAISAGRAHDEGKTQLDGRTVERIRIDPPSACPFPGCPREPSYAYVDPETFYPVETHGPAIAGVGSRVFARLHIVKRILTYEYLPRTEANLALTDIRAQHPNAVGP